LEYVLLTDTIDPSQEPIQLNRVLGDKDDPQSLIYPFKVHRGMMPYDTEKLTMLSPKLFGKTQDAYWKSYDWEKSLEAGMAAHDLDFSGNFDFIETSYYFQITHMVAPAENSLECNQCHSRQGRLAALSGFYMPGRDHNGLLDLIGWLVVFGSLAGVVGHGILRRFLGGSNH
ncbi:MAG: cytochrome C, partial [Desulfosudaceae bacterium]